MKLILLFGYVANICVLNDFCFDVVDQGNAVAITVQSNGNFGWLAIGIGSSMIGSDMMLIWKAKNHTNYILSDRKSVGYQNPKPYPVQSLSMVKFNNTGLTFTRPRSINDGHITVQGTMDWIWAYSNNSPNSDDYTATITKHSQAGVVLINPQGGITVESLYKSNIMLLWHAILMFLSWNILPFIGISIASTYRKYFALSWFRIHVLCFSLLFFTYHFFCICYNW